MCLHSSSPPCFARDFCLRPLAFSPVNVSSSIFNSKQDLVQNCRQQLMVLASGAIEEIGAHQSIPTMKYRRYSFRFR